MNDLFFILFIKIKYYCLRNRLLLIFHLQYRWKKAIEMTTIFKKTLRPILIFCKILGIITFSYSLKSGLLCKNKKLINVFFEFVRTILLIIYTFHYHKTVALSEHLFILKLWFIIITARLSEKWIIRYDIKQCTNVILKYHYIIYYETINVINTN